MINAMQYFRKRFLMEELIMERTVRVVANDAAALTFGYKCVEIFRKKLRSDSFPGMLRSILSKYVSTSPSIKKHFLRTFICEK
jgi:hypothetical protein